MANYYYLLSFLLCFFQFMGGLSGQSNFSDCSNARILCDKSPISINELSGYGNLLESSSGDCFRDDFKESNSIWLKWQVAESGLLAFTILPLNGSDDVDFVLYRLNSIENCTDKELMRCMAAGPNLGSEISTVQSCTGATGLRVDNTNISHSSGCQDDSDNFLSAISVNSGEYYTLFINNFRSTGGMVIEWSGSATFQHLSEQCSISATQSPILNNGKRLRLSEPFPNPSNQIVYIQADSEEVQAGQIQVINYDGHIENTRIFSLPSGKGMLELPVENLQPGVHFIKVSTAAETYISRFVKQ